MTEPQKNLINLAKANGGSVTTVSSGQKVAARKLLKLGVFRLSGINEYSLVGIA